jgi:hypothetical protein
MFSPKGDILINLHFNIRSSVLTVTKTQFLHNHKIITLFKLSVSLSNNHKNFANLFGKWPNTTKEIPFFFALNSDVSPNLRDLHTSLRFLKVFCSSLACVHEQEDFGTAKHSEAAEKNATLSRFFGDFHLVCLSE